MTTSAFYHGTWDPATVTAPLSLSVGNTVASTPSGASLANGSVKSTPSVTISNLTFFSFNVLASGNEFWSVGICNAAYNVADDAWALGGDAGGNSLGTQYFSVTAGLYLQGTLVANVLGTFGAPTEIVIAIDTGAALAWISNDGGATWNGGTGNPCLGTGGGSIAGLGAGPYFAIYKAEEDNQNSLEILSPSGIPCPVIPPPPIATPVRFLVCGPNWTIAQPTNKVYGLDHLAGQLVTGLLDGVVIPLTVVHQDGSIDLPFAATSIRIGLAFTAQVQTPYLDIGNPTVQGRRKDITAVTVRVDTSAVPNIGSNQPDGGALVPPIIDPPWVGLLPGVTQNPDQQPTTYIGPSGQTTTRLFSGDFRANITPDWNEKGQVAIEQTKPLPMAITACIPELLDGDIPEQTYSEKQYGRDQQQPAHPRPPGTWMLSR